jgi:L-rhamnose mutarotase
MTQHFGQTILLRDAPGVIDDYERYHAAIWPEVAAGLRAVGIEQMRIWRIGRRLFMHMETTDTFDATRDFGRYERDTHRAAEWQRLMESLQEPVPEARPGEWWAQMKLVFEL